VAGDFHHVLSRIGTGRGEERDYYFVDKSATGIEEFSEPRLPGPEFRFQPDCGISDVDGVGT